MKKEQDRTNDVTLNAYPCRDCGGFHLGHMNMKSRWQRNAASRRLVDLIERVNSERREKK